MGWLHDYLAKAGAAVSSAAGQAADTAEHVFSDVKQTVKTKAHDAASVAEQAFTSLEDTVKRAAGLSAPVAVDGWEQRGYPAYMTTKGNKDFNARGLNRAILGQFPANTLPKTLANVSAYRADPTGRFGGQDGLETQPIVFAQQDQGAGYTYTAGKPAQTGGGSPAELYALARSLGAARKFGVPQLSAQELAAMALKEGRSDYGWNSSDSDNPELEQRIAGGQDAWSKLVSTGGPALTAVKFPATVAEKAATAKRLGVPFLQVWNGAGPKAKAYADSFDAYLKAAQHPRNKALVDLIQQGLNDGYKYGQ